jgi:hypothetical protein
LGGKIVQDHREVRGPGRGPCVATEHPNDAPDALSANVAVNLAKAHAAIFLGINEAVPGHHGKRRKTPGRQMGDVLAVHLMVDHCEHVGGGDGGGRQGSLDANVGNRQQGGGYGDGPVPHVHAGVEERQSFAMLLDFGILERPHDPLPIRCFKQEVPHGFVEHVIILPKAKFELWRLQSHRTTSSMSDPCLK